jgi:hypothetical protein
MISLRKNTNPSILMQKGKEWTDELLSFIYNGQKVPSSVQGRYRHQEIKETLIKETYGKCAYCESKILHIDYGDIEHIEPKMKVPEKTFDWNNLTLSCNKCNLKKKEYYNPCLPLLNPYKDNPEKEILFMGPFPFAKPGSDKAKITIKRLNLDRAELIERRKDHLKKIEPLLELYEKTIDEELRVEIKKDILYFIEPDQEYSSMVSNLLIHPLLPQVV